MPSVNALLALLAGLFLSAGAQGAEPVAVDAEIVLAVDASASVDGAELVVQRGGYVQALRHPDLIRAVRTGRLGRVALSYFEWWGHVRDDAHVPWHIIDSREAAEAFAAAVAAWPKRSGYGTSISRALDFAAALIEGNGIAGAKRIIDVSGDGPNNIGPPVSAARDAAVARGITVNGLPILLRPSTIPAIDRYYERCVIGGAGAFLLPVRSAKELVPAIRRKLILEISGRQGVRLVPAADPPPIDCMIGEKRRGRGKDHFPGLYE